jgi:hypothetical protein
LNDGGGCSNLGLSYEKGKGVKQDDFKALKFYQKVLFCGPCVVQLVLLVLLVFFGFFLMLYYSCFFSFLGIMVRKL